MVPDDASELADEAAQVRRELRRASRPTRGSASPPALRAVPRRSALLACAVRSDHARSACSRSPGQPSPAAAPTGRPPARHSPPATTAGRGAARTGPGRRRRRSPVPLRGLLPAVIMLIDGCACPTGSPTPWRAAPAGVTVVTVSRERRTAPAPAPTGDARRPYARCATPPAGCASPRPAGPPAAPRRPAGRPRPARSSAVLPDLGADRALPARPERPGRLTGPLLERAACSAYELRLDVDRPVDGRQRQPERPATAQHRRHRRTCRRSRCATDRRSRPRRASPPSCPAGCTGTASRSRAPSSPACRVTSCPGASPAPPARSLVERGQLTRGEEHRGIAVDVGDRARRRVDHRVRPSAPDDLAASGPPHRHRSSGSACRRRVPAAC